MIEDIFSEELVDVPDDIERVVEGGEDDIHNVSGIESGNEETKNDDENGKDKDKVKVKRKLGPRPTLNAERLKGPRGIGIMESFFSDIKLKGKGKEKEDLDIIMGRLEHWAHRLFPRMQFDEALKKIETLGNKKTVANYVKRIRLGLEDDELPGTGIIDEPPESPPTVDVFDQLVASTVVPPQPTVMEMTEEQRERMLQNRLIAEERRNARLKRAKELKEKFQANQAQSQSANSQQLETERKRTNEKSGVEINEQHRLEMEIDEIVIPETDSISVDQTVNNRLNDKQNEDSLQTKENYVQLHLDDRDNSLVSELQKNELETSMEVQSDFNQENVNGPDIVERNDNPPYTPRESEGNQPTIISSQKCLPDILAERDAMIENESQTGKTLERMSVQSDDLENVKSQSESGGNLPDVLP